MHKMMTNSDLYRTIKLPEGVIRQLYKYEKNVLPNYLPK